MSRSSSLNWSHLIQNMTVGVVYQDLNGTILEVNQSAERLLGLSADQMMGRSSVDKRWKSIKENGEAFPGDEHPAMVALATGEIVENVIMGVFHPLNQEWVWIRINSFPDFDPDTKELKGVFTTFNDISEKQSAEEKLKEINKELLQKTKTLESLLHSQSNYVVKTDLSGNITYCNDSYVTNFNHAHPNGIIGSHGFESILPHHHERASQAVKECFEKPGSVVQIELDKPGPDGNVRTSLWEFTAIPDDNGIPLEMLAIGIDLTKYKSAQRELYLSEEKYRSLVEESDNIIITIDRYGKIFYGNSKAAQLIGVPQYKLSEGEFSIGLFYNEEEQHEGLKKDLGNLFDFGIGYTKITSLKIGDKTIWVKGTATPIFDENGKVIMAHVNAMDITELREKEEQLALSEQKYKGLIEASDALVIVVDEHGNYVLVNQRAAKYIKKEPEHFIGLTLWDTHEKEEGERIFHRITEVLKTNKGLITETSQQINDKEIWFRTSFQPINAFNNEKRTVMIMSTDITDRVTAERQVAQSEAKYRSLIESSDSIIAMFDLSGQAIYANEVASRLVNLTPEQALNMKFNLSNIFPEGRKDEVINDIQTIIQTKKGINEEVNVELNGRNLYFKSSFQPVFDKDGEVSAVLLNATDITEQKNIEIQLRNSEDNYKNLFYESPQAYLIIQDGIFIECNKASERLMNANREYIIGKSPFEISPVDQPNGRKSTELVPEYLKIVEEKGDFLFEWVHVKKDGSHFLAEINLFSGQYQGRPSVLVLWKDITEEKRNQKTVNQLSQIVNQSPVSIIMTDLDGKIQYANKATSQNLGYSFEEIKDQNPRIWKSEHTTIEEYKEMWDTVLGGDKWQGEFLNVRKDGRLVCESSTIFPIFDGDGNISNLVAIQEDISERKKAESELRLFQTVFDNAVNGRLITDLNGKIIYCNEFYADLHGIDKEVLIGTYCVQQISDVSLPQYQIVRRKLIQNLTIPSTELEHKRKDGSTFPALVNASVILDEKGESKYISITVLDISDRKQIENEIIELNLSLEEKVKDRTKELENAIGRLETFFNVSLDMLCIADQEGRFIKLSKAFEDVLHYERHELEGRNYLDFIHPDDLDDTINAMQALQGQIRVIQFVNRYRTKEGDYRFIEWYSSPVGKYVYAVARDITDRKNKELELIQARKTAEEANTSKSLFLSRMSHELRTPMNSILGFAQLLEMSEMNEMQESSVQHILNSGKHLLGLINEVLDIARIETGKITLSIEQVNVTEAVKEVCTLLDPLARKSGIELIIGDTLTQNLFIQADQQRTIQILTNLINNGIKYNRPDGKVFIEQQETINDEGIEMIRISIRDTGVGIKTEDLGKLFTPFERIGAQNTNIEGTGLGLAVVKELITLLNGKVGIESIENQGSTFWIELPKCKIQDTHLKDLEKEDSSSLKLSEKDASILYIEDNVMNISLVEDIFKIKRPGYDLITTIYGNEGLKIADQFQPQLILLDLDLPDKHGSIVLKELKENTKTADIPVIIVSADATKDQINKLMEGGATKYVTKPFEIKDFLEIVDHFVKSTY